MTVRSTAQVAVIVIGYNDVENLPTAVASALDQGPQVAEVIVVDDASSDGTGEAAVRLAERDPRVRVHLRQDNSGGCGTPRNDGMALATAPWIMFLDSDDVLPPGAVRALLDAACAQDADVAAGLCVRRELPANVEVPWQPLLFTEPWTGDGVTGRPRMLWDTLCVNKLYRRSFLREHGLRFPDGAAHYEDFVFTAGVYAHATRFTVVTDPVYVWNVRRTSTDLSISLRRDTVGNWLDRIAAHRQAVEYLQDSRNIELAIWARAKFLEHDLCLYLRDLPRRGEQYRREWWDASRSYLSSFTDSAFAKAEPAARWAAAFVRGHAGPEAVQQLSELAAVPPRLLGPCAPSADGHTWAWQVGSQPTPLDGLAELDLAALPLVVHADVEVVRAAVSVTLHVEDLADRLSQAFPQSVRLELRERTSPARRTLPPETLQYDGRAWSAHFEVTDRDLRPGGIQTTWDVWALVEYRDGEVTATKVRAETGLGRRMLVPTPRRLLLVQPYSTSSSSLAVRAADGVAGARTVLARRWRRVTAAGHRNPR